MSAQPVELSQPPIPAFEGTPVAATRLRISGMSQADVGTDVVVSTDDMMRLVGEFRVVGVRHYVDEKTGDLIREHIAKPVQIDLCPFDPSDPSDDGVVRARPRP